MATVTEIAAVGQLEDRRQPTTTLEGWRRFVDADPPEFALLDDDVWASLGEDERTAYNEARVAHHSELVVVTTSAIESITHQGRLLTLLNQREIGARRGLIISGGAATGKTTAIKQLGRFHELRTHARFPGDESRIPVVYVTAPPKGSPRKLAMEFARFLGLPTLNQRMNVTDISDAVCQVLIDARTDIVVVDFTDRRNIRTRRSSCVTFGTSRGCLPTGFGMSVTFRRRKRFGKATGGRRSPRAADRTQRRVAVVDDRLARGNRASRGGPVPASP